MKIKAAVIHEMGKAPPYVDSNPLTIEELDLDISVPPAKGN